MKKTVVVMIILIGIILIILVRSKAYAPVKKNNQSTPSSDQGAQTQTIKPVVSYYYPITNYDQRIKVHSYGTYVKPGDEKLLVCGRAFSGYHTGDDLEITSTENNIAVPIKAIAAGTVRQVGWVSGYGGLVVIEHNLRGQVVTAYYGHLNIGSVILKAGSKVVPGQVIGNLGQGCSQQTDYERKHLHFDIHKGTAIDVRGYVPTLSLLSQWLNPKTELAKLGAK